MTQRAVPTSMSLAQVARLAQVQRPVVTIWRSRPVPGVPFPAPMPDGRFETTKVLDYLEATGRGNNPDARIDLALHQAISKDTPSGQLEGLLALVAARVIVGQPLAQLDPDDVLDAVEEADGDDEWLWTEISDLQVAELSARADALVEAAWTPADAHRRLVAELDLRAGSTPALTQPLVTMLAEVTRGLLAPGGSLIDVHGSATEVVLELLSDEDLPDISVVLPAAGDAARRAHQQLSVRGIHPRRPAVDAWECSPGSVALVRLPKEPQQAMDTLFEVQASMTPGSAALVIGPPTALVDAGADENPRARLLSMEGVVRAIVRLPRGLLTLGAHDQLGLWVLGMLSPEELRARQEHRAKAVGPGRSRRAPAVPGPGDAVRVADLSGVKLDSNTRQHLVDDLVAAGLLDRRRAYHLLHAVRRSDLDGRHRSLVAQAGSGRPDLPPPSAVGEAETVRTLLEELRAPLSNPLDGLQARPTTGRDPQRQSLGELVRSRHVRMLHGSRAADWDDLPRGHTKVWTPSAVTDQTPALLALPHDVRDSGSRHRTRAGDVVFSPVGKPTAVVDDQGGTQVASPSRILRIHADAPLSARAVAVTINDLKEGSGAWRTWLLPISHRHRDGDDALKLLDAWDEMLRDKQEVVDDLRRVLVRSLLRGTVALTPGSPADTNSKGQ